MNTSIIPAKISFNENEVTVSLARYTEPTNAQYLLILTNYSKVRNLIYDKSTVINIMNENIPIPYYLKAPCPKGYEITGFSIEKFNNNISSVILTIEPVGSRKG